MSEPRPNHKYRSKEREGNRLKDEPGEQQEQTLNEEKAEPAVAEAKTAKKEKPQAPKREPFKNIKLFFADERTVRSLGIISLLAAAYLFIAFTSFLFTWENDQDKVMGPWAELLANNEIKVDNWLGKFGAIISHIFLYKWFGIASFLFVLNLLLTGLHNTFHITLLPLAKTLRISFFFLLWTCISCGYFFSGSAFFPGGIVGFEANNWLVALLGSAGTFLLIISSLLLFLVISYNVSFRRKKPDAIHFTPEPTNEQENTEEIKNLLKDKMLHPDVLETTAKEPVAEPVLKPLTVEQPPVIVEPVIEQHIETTPEETPVAVVEDERKVTISHQGHSEITADGIHFEVESIAEEIKELAGDAVVTEDKELAELAALGEYDPTLELSSYLFPPLDLLEKRGSDSITVNNEELSA